MRKAIAISILIAAVINWFSIPIMDRRWEVVVRTRIEEVPDTPNEKYDRSIREDVMKLANSSRVKGEDLFNAIFYNAIFLSVVGVLLIISEAAARIQRLQVEILKQDTTLTKPTNEKITAKFKMKRIRNILSAVPVALVFIVLISTDKTDGLFGIPAGIVWGFSIVIIISMSIFSLFNWRCPSCYEHLGGNFNPKYCSKCNIQLR